MASNGIFEWERPLVELEQRLAELRAFGDQRGIGLAEEIAVLERRAQQLREEIYRNLTPWQRVLIARHSARPTFLDYVRAVFQDFVELHGDRRSGDDGAVVGGVAWLDGRPVTVIGTQKGRDTKENLRRNFGLPHPEGYRKALRLMRQAEKFGRPVFTFVDVVGAFPGIEAEERGQGVAIAENIMAMTELRTPVVVTITGEGGSGGALAIGVGDRVFMLEHAWYSVISPEMCATILWRDASRAPEAAAMLRLTAADLLKWGIIDAVVPEPPGGAHRDPAGAAALLRPVLVDALHEVEAMQLETLLAARRERYRRAGYWQQLVVEGLSEGRADVEAPAAMRAPAAQAQPQPVQGEPPAAPAPAPPAPALPAPAVESAASAAAGAGRRGREAQRANRGRPDR